MEKHILNTWIEKFNIIKLLFLLKLINVVQFIKNLEFFFNHKSMVVMAFLVAAKESPHQPHPHPHLETETVHS